MKSVVQAIFPNLLTRWSQKVEQQSWWGRGTSSFGWMESRADRRRRRSSSFTVHSRLSRSHWQGRIRGCLLQFPVAVPCVFAGSLSSLSGICSVMFQLSLLWSLWLFINSTSHTITHPLSEPPTESIQGPACCSSYCGVLWMALWTSHLLDWSWALECA